PRACRVRTRSATSRAPRQYATAWRGAMPGRLHRAGRPPSRRDIVARNESLERAPGRAAIARGPIDRRAMDVHDGHEVAPNPPPARGPLTGIRVVELADEQAEYCGLTLAGLGADVVKVEPPDGSPTRRIGPFYQDVAGAERSLFFWQYNRGKRSIVLDLNEPGDRGRFRGLVAGADVLLESTPRGELDGHGLGAGALGQEHPALVVARVTPFGDAGPWAGFKGSDLVHLALGGVMMNCGYDPAPGGAYDLPPI